MDTMLTWTTRLLSKHCGPEADAKQAAILDIGTGNGVLPLELAGQGYANVTGVQAYPTETVMPCTFSRGRHVRIRSCRCCNAGSDYSEASIKLARAIADRRGITSVRWVIDDLLHSGLTDRCAVGDYISPLLTWCCAPCNNSLESIPPCH